TCRGCYGNRITTLAEPLIDGSGNPRPTHHGATRGHAVNYPAEISTSLTSSKLSPTIVIGPPGIGSDWRSSPRRTGPKTALMRLTTARPSQLSTNPTPSRSGGATTTAHLPTGSAWARLFTWRSNPDGRLVENTPVAGDDRLSSGRSRVFLPDQRHRQRS